MSSIIGMIAGVAVILATNYLEGDPVSALLNASAALIVFGGTLAALLVHSGPRGLLSAVKRLGWLLKPPGTDAVQFIEQITEWANINRSKGLLALEEIADQLDDRFIKTGLTMIVSNQPSEEIHNTLFLVGEVEDREASVAGDVWEAAGGYAPTIGVLGAVLGLIHVMLNLDQPSTLGIGIATAFIATVYGVGSANLIFFPLGQRLKGIAAGRGAYRDVALEGLLLLLKGASPLIIRERLEHLLESRRRAARQDDGESADRGPVAGAGAAQARGGA
jgi:chemotaxis protein MotA